MKVLSVLSAAARQTRKAPAGKVGIPLGKNKTTCPVCALELWLKKGKIKSGPVFRAVNRHGQVSRRGSID